jgi:hypothetical protein
VRKGRATYENQHWPNKKEKKSKDLTGLDDMYRQDSSKKRAETKSCHDANVNEYGGES